MNSRKQLGPLLKGLRKGEKLTQVQLAKLSGVPQQTISALESSKTTNVQLDTLESLCRALKVPTALVLMDGVTPELLLDPRLIKLIGNYRAADDQAREWILKFSERETA